MRDSIFHPVRLTLYAVLSAADLGLTYALIRHGDGDVYESNPIADAWLNAYGWAGLAVFKLVIVLLVAALAAFVSLSRPRTGGHILTFACLAVAIVVGYSVRLAYAEELHAKLIASPIATLQPSGRKQVLWGLVPVRTGSDGPRVHPQRHGK